MKKLFILIVLAGVLLIGCSAETKTVTNSYIMPTELSDCKVYSLSNGMNEMRVVYCPNAITTTTHTVEKTTVSNTVIAVDTNTDTSGLGEYNRLKQKFDTTGIGEYQRLKEKFAK